MYFSFFLRGTQKDFKREDTVVTRMAAHLRRISKKYDLDSSSSDSYSDSEGSSDKNKNEDTGSGSKTSSSDVVDLISDTDEIDEIAFTPAPKKKQLARKREEAANCGGDLDQGFDWDELMLVTATAFSMRMPRASASQCARVLTFTPKQL